MIQVLVLHVQHLDTPFADLFLFKVVLTIAESLRQVHNLWWSVHLKVDRGRLHILLDETLGELLTWRHYGVVFIVDVSWHLFLEEVGELASIKSCLLPW